MTVKTLMELVKEVVVKAVEPKALAGGYRQVGRTEWRRSCREVITGISLEISKGSASTRDFSLDWSIYVPGLASLLYGQEESPVSGLQWPAVGGTSQKTDPALGGDWLKATLPMTDYARAALEQQVGGHGDSIVRFLGSFDTRKDVRIFLLESSGRDWVRMSQPASPIRKLEVAAGLAALDGDEQDTLRLIGELDQTISGTPWDNADGRRPLERIRAVAGRTLA
jgi:hypothetical protein